MPRARNSTQNIRQTAVTLNGSGCLSLYSLSLFAVALITCLVTALSFSTPIRTNAAVSSQMNSSASTDISPIFTLEVQYWVNDILRWANASSLDPNLVAVVMQIESCGNPFARSSVGATGLFQVMPSHFQIGENPYNIDTNAFRGLNYLSRSLETSHGNVLLALAGYNAGIGIITRAKWTWPSETLRYVYYGASIYEDAQRGTTSSPKLEEWYQKYGVSLCRQARQKLGIG